MRLHDCKMKGDCQPLVVFISTAARIREKVIKLHFFMMSGVTFLTLNKIILKNNMWKGIFYSLLTLFVLPV